MSGTAFCSCSCACDRSLIYKIWKASGYNVDFEGYGHDRHAWVVNAACLEFVLRYIEGAHGLRILQ